jgi:hypothetical protein
MIAWLAISPKPQTSSKATHPNIISIMVDLTSEFFVKIIL